MSVAQKRAVLTWAYPGSAWLEKVKNMSDKQVHATYMRMLNHNKLKGIPSNVEARKS